MLPFVVMLFLFIAVACLFIWVVAFKNNSSSKKAAGLSPVCRQHLEVYQGSEIPGWLVEKQKKKLQDHIYRRQNPLAEKLFVPGLDFLINVRALMEIGDENSTRILQNLLTKIKTKDPIEKSWYMIDLANALRTLHHGDSLGQLSEVFNKQNDLALAPLFAAEILCFDSFINFYRSSDQPDRKKALRVLLSVMEGLYSGISFQVIAESRMGDLLECIWDNKADGEYCPIHVSVFINASRISKRCQALSESILPELPDPEEFLWQLRKMDSLESFFKNYIEEAKKQLAKDLENEPWSTHGDFLKAMNDLRCAPADIFAVWLKDPGYPFKTLLWDSFLYSPTPMGKNLIELFEKKLSNGLQSKALLRLLPNPNPELLSLCKILKKHPCPEAENFLLEMGQTSSAELLVMVLSSIGWWEPHNFQATKLFLDRLRNHRNMEIRFAANAALARLGERKALDWLRFNLNNADINLVHQTIHVVSTQGICLLWPELDSLVEAPDLDIAMHAREAIANLSEEFPGS